MQTRERSELEARYQRGDTPWPIAFDEWETAAEQTLPRRAFDYVAGGAGDGSAVQHNRDAFLRYRLRPHMLSGHTDRDLSVEILGLRAPVPFLVAPVGVLGIIHPDAELAVARSCRALGVPFVVSSCASTSMETIAGALGDTPRWYQLYWVSDRDVAASFVARAESSGYSAIVVTVDTLTLGWRDRDLRNDRYLPFLEGDGIAQFTSDAVFMEKLGSTDEGDPIAAGTAMVTMFSNLALGWDDLAWLREQTRLPILIKGILRGDDAKRCMDLGVDGIVVSNHGGRQVDAVVATVDALVDVRASVGDDYPVLLDSGIRRAADVIKALALGADAVLLGRPYVWGLAVGGEAGVTQVLTTLRDEIDVTLALLGAPRVTALDRSYLTP